METPECIDPELGKAVAALEWSSLAENAIALSQHPSARMQVRLHLFSCPFCRERYLYAKDALALVNRVIIDRVADVLTYWCDEWRSDPRLSRKPKSQADFASWLAVLAIWGIEVQNALSFAAEEPANFTTEIEELDQGASRISVSKCWDFILLLKPEVQQFVFEAVRCQEMVMPPVHGDFGPAQLFPPLDEIEASEYEAEQTALKDDKASFAQQFAKALSSGLSDISTESLYHGILALASTRLDRFRERYKAVDIQRGAISQQPFRNPFSKELESLQRQQSDGFDSLKAGQMEMLRLFEQNSRPAATFEPGIEANLGPLYRKLNEQTRRQLQVAEYLYSINRNEPDYSHGSVMNIALAYENELLFELVWPFLEKLRAEGKPYYDGGAGDPKRALMKDGTIQRKNIGLPSFRWCLRADAEIRAWMKKSKSINTEDVIRDLNWIIPKRDDAAHKLVCRLSTADEVRDWVFRSDGPLSRVHPKLN